VEVRYGSILVPEPFLQAMLLCAALLFVLAEKQKNWFLGFASGVCLGFSYLTKEPAVFVAMAFVVFALVEHRWRLASSVLAGAVLVAAGELSWYWSETGDLLFRLHALAVHNTDTMDKAIRAANEHLAFRLLEAYPRMMLAPNVDFGLHSIFALALAAAAVFQRPFRKWTLFLLIWAALPFAYLNFGTSSFSYYWAIPALPRYISPIYPPLFILAAAVLLRTTATHPVSRGLGMVAVTIVCIVGVYCARLTRGTDYRTEHVRRLKQVAADARRNNQQICEFRGSEAYLWRLALGIIAPDRIGCSGAGVLRLVPDPMGLPVTKAL
ncbi:MAG TPA: glycosyltransferase family 39 protein, partial [Candidatus Acidoferrales bacterium]|nr:glycosyltransferase family 39 protein [Candidatus Acidoferrales bacterium]